MLASVLSGCRNEISEIKAIMDPQHLPVQTTENAHYRYTEDGRLRNELLAVRLDQYEGEDAYLEASGGFEMIFFDSLMHEEARLKAMRGRFYQKQNKLIAWENVQLFNVHGEKLETEELLFEQDSSRISTDKFVTITTRSGVIHGKGLISNDSFTRYRILQPTGDLYVDEKDQPTP